MKYKTLTGLLCIVLAAVSASTVASDTLRNNPFEQPDMNSDLLQTNAAKAAGNELKLRGTLIDGSDSLVNINGQFYRLNQEVSGYRVVGIKGTSVTLRRGSNEIVLTLNDDK